MDPRADALYEPQYREVKRSREARKAGEEKALLAELKEQNRPDSKGLQRAFAEQEREREELGKKRREEGERRSIEAELALTRGGFQYDP